MQKLQVSKSCPGEAVQAGAALPSKKAGPVSGRLQGFQPSGPWETPGGSGKHCIAAASKVLEGAS